MPKVTQRPDTADAGGEYMLCSMRFRLTDNRTDNAMISCQFRRDIVALYGAFSTFKKEYQL